MKRIILEVLLVAVVGVMVALIANLISPRGLSLTRDYFPSQGNAVTGPAPSSTPVRNPQNETKPGASSLPSVVTKEPPAKGGIITVATERALEFFRDPQYEQELIVFVDARDNRHYEAGHIPGAYQLDRYYPEKHLPTVLPACLNAMRVVVYCTGGECEDSHFAAQLLRDAGIPPEQLFVYAGGITEWEARRLPIEAGARKSGNLRETKP